MRKVLAIVIGFVVFEVAFLLLGMGLRPLREGGLSEPAWWTLRVLGIAVGLLAALYVGSRFWPRRQARDTQPRG